MLNAPIDAGLSFFTDFQFGQTPLYEASTTGESSAMLATAIVGVLAGGSGAAGTVGAVARAGSE